MQNRSAPLPGSWPDDGGTIPAQSRIYMSSREGMVPYGKAWCTLATACFPCILAPGRVRPYVDALTTGNTCKRTINNLKFNPCKKSITSGGDGLTSADFLQDIRTFYVFQVPWKTVKVWMSCTESANVRPFPPDVIPLLHGLNVQFSCVYKYFKW
jgi:hypothetical protein